MNLRASTTRVAARALALLGTTAALSACQPDPSELTVPDAAAVEAAYTVENRMEVEVTGNVAEVVIYQASDQLRRGGTLWAKVGPYIFLFSEPTRALFEEYPGLAAVRMITRDPSGDLVARATLERASLNALTWRRALNIAGKARRDGTTRLTTLEDLIAWGEDHTEFEYAERYTRQR